MRTVFFSIFFAVCLAVFMLSFKDANKTYQNLLAIQNTQTKDLPSKSNSAFKEGEILQYRLHYGIVDAGVAILEVKPENKTIGGREVYHIVGNGYSKGSFDWFFKVRDRYETFMDKDALVPWLFIRRCEEGGYFISQDYIFNQYTNKVNIGEGQDFSVVENTHDMVSAFYAARNLDFSNAKKGDVFSVRCFVDKELWDLKIRYIGKETIDSDIGKVKCLKFCPIIQKGRIFKREEDLNVWISDDKNHVPVRAQAKILFGAVKMDLTSVKGLANPIAIAN